MDISFLLYKGVVYIPTSYTIERGFYFEHAPVESVPVTQTGKLRQAILNAIERGNPSISRDEVSALSGGKSPPMLAATGAPSWHAFDRQTEGNWSISEKSGLYKIRVRRPLEKQGWHEDPDKEICFPSGTPVEEVIDRLITMIQERARQ